MEVVVERRGLEVAKLQASECDAHASTRRYFIVAVMIGTVVIVNVPRRSVRGRGMRLCVNGVHIFAFLKDVLP